MKSVTIGEKTRFMCTITVVGSGADTDWISIYGKRENRLLAGLRIAETVKTTSALVSGCPSCHLTPDLSL